MLVSLLFFSIFQHIHALNYTKYYCTYNAHFKPSEIHLKPNEITFIETYKFPNVQDYYNEASLDHFCIMNFYIEPSSKNKSVIILVTNPFSIEFFSVYNVNNFISWRNSKKINYFDDQFEFQGIAFHNELNENECFLGSVSQPYHFYDEEQILYIRSSILEVNARKNPCNWHFSAPDGFGFKIVVTELNVKPDVTLAVTNSTNFYIVNQHSAILNKPYYNEDKDIFIFLSKTNQTFRFPTIEFGAYITIVKKNPIVFDDCINYEESAGIILWTNALSSTGYANNVHCTFELEIFPNTIVAYAFSQDYYLFPLENADTITFYDVYSNSYERYYPVPRYLDTGKILFPYKNNTVRKVLWEFKSDGSVRNGGFALNFFRTDCFCGNPIWFVTCDGDTSYYSITNTSTSDGIFAGTYCSNMKCNFTIQFEKLCPNKYIQVALYPSVNPSRINYVNDHFRLISDSNVTLNYNLSSFHSDDVIYVLANPKTNIIFEAITTEYELEFSREMLIELKAVDEPKPTFKALLTKQKPYFFIDASSYLSPVDIFTIEIEDIAEFKNAYIEIYTSQIFPVSLFKDETLSEQLIYSDCFSEKTFYCNTKVKKFAIWSTSFAKFYENSNPNMLFFFFQIAPKELIGKCMFDNNVFIATAYKINLNVTFSAITKSNGTCKIFVIPDFIDYNIFNLDNFNFQKIWTNALKENVKVYTAYENETLLFEFNQDTCGNWQRIAINAPFYIFEIPTNSSLYIVTNNSESAPPVLSEIKPYAYQTVLQSPYYHFYKKNCFANFFIDEGIFVTFHATFNRDSPHAKLIFSVDDEPWNVNKVGTTFTVTNVSVLICYEYDDSPRELQDLIIPEIIFHLYIRTNNDSIFDTTTGISSLPITSTTTRIITPNNEENHHALSDNYSVAFIACFILFIIFCSIALWLRKNK